MTWVGRILLWCRLTLEYQFLYEFRAAERSADYTISTPTLLNTHAVWSQDNMRIEESLQLLYISPLLSQVNLLQIVFIH